MATRRRSGGGEAEAKEDMHDALDALHEVSQILNTGLDRETLLLCVKLCNNGVNPEALAGVVKYLRDEASRVAKVASGPSTSSS